MANNSHKVIFKTNGILFLLGWLLIVPCLGDEVGNDKNSENNNIKSHSLQVRQSKSVFIPGDAVSISTLPDTTSFLNAVFPIDDRGYVELPVYGKAKISNMSKEQFVNFLRKNFRDYLHYPTLQVKPMIRISVLGGVFRPGFYYFDPDYSLWEVLHQAGGTLHENGLKYIKWKRSGKDVSSNLIATLQSGISLKRMGFRSGDQVWVKTPNQPGFVDKARRYVTFLTAAASALTLYITYQRVLVQGN